MGYIIECSNCGKKKEFKTLGVCPCSCGAITLASKVDGEVVRDLLSTPEERDHRIVNKFLTPIFDWLGENRVKIWDWTEKKAWPKTKKNTKKAKEAVKKTGDSMATKAAADRADAKTKYDAVKNQKRGLAGRVLAKIFWE
ncbi:MAG: hypothetical protein WCT37_02890 [Patescibacteria group bacterium]|jgi:hypothetical protein